MSCFLKMTLLIWFFSTVWNSFQECKWKIKHFSFFKHSYLRIPILLNLTNYFHHFNDFPSTEACFLEVTTGSSHKTWKIKKSSFGNFNMHCWQSVTIVTKQSFSIPFFSVKWLSFMTPMTQLIFPYKKTVYRILSRKMRILAFSFFLTWDSSILLNFINYLHHLSLGSSKSTHFNDCPSSEACFLHVTSFFIPKKSKTQKFDFEKSQFLQFRSQQNAIFALNPLIFH